MKSDVCDTCVALVMSRTSGPSAGRQPRPSALGWRLEQDLPTIDVEALHVSIRGALTGAAVPRRWARSAWLRALLVEYRNVRLGGAPARARLVAVRRDAAVRAPASTRASRADSD